MNKNVHTIFDNKIFLLALGFVLSAVLSIMIVWGFWNHIKEIPVEQTIPLETMALYVGATLFFGILATALLMIFKKFHLSIGIYMIAFLWMSFYIGQRAIDFDFFYDFRFKKDYNEEKNQFRPQVAESIILEGDKKLASGNLLGAKQDYMIALDFDTSNARIYFSLGNTYMRLGSNDTARVFFLEGLKRDYEMPVMHNYIGVLSEKLEDYDTAIRAFRTAIRLDTSFALARTNLATAIRMKQNYDNAIKAGMIRVRQIVANTQDEARKFKRMIDRGADFAVIAENYSIEPVKVTPFFPPDRPNFPLAEISRDLKVGEVSGIIEIAGKFLIIKRIN